MTPLSDNATPYAEEAERGCLSCILQDPIGILPQALQSVPPPWFYNAAHRQLYEVLLDFYKGGRPVDIVTVSSHLLDHQIMDKIGGPAVLPLSFVPTSAHWPYYVEILKEKHGLRTILQTCANITSNVYTRADDWRKSVTSGIADLSDLLHEGHARRWVNLAAFIDDAVTRTEQALSKKGHVTNGLATGFTDLDRRMMGLRGGELIIIGARPAMGKSALAFNLAECIATASGHYPEFQQDPLCVAVVSREMPGIDIADRLIVGRSGVAMGKIATGHFSRKDTGDYMKAAAELQRAKMPILVSGRLSIQELFAELRHKVPELGIKCLIVDYLQRLSSDSKKAAQNRNVEMSEVSSGLKDIAIEFGIPVIALAQVGRSAEDRPGCIPQLADLRESGDIEADADFVWLLHREGYYLRKKKKKAGRGHDDDDEDEDEIRDDNATLYIAKARRGAVEPVPLGWDGPRTRFSSTTSHLFSNNPDKREHAA